MFQTTRRQLALWYTTVTAILLLLFASVFYVYVRGTLIERIDDTLNHVVEVVQRSLVIEPVNPHFEGSPLRVNIEASFRDNQSTREDDHIDLEWFNATGELLWSTLTEPLDIPLHTDSDGETVQIIRHSTAEESSTNLPANSSPSAADPLILRQVTHRVEVGRQVLGYLRVSHPWFEVTKPIRQLFFDLILWLVVIVAAVGAIGWFLSGLAMAPIRESYQRLKQFTADASHELRNPIAIIQTNVQVALADPDPQPQTQQHHLQVVERLTRRLGRLVDDLLFLARQDSGIVQTQRSQVCLDDLLKDVIEEQQTIATEKGVHLSLKIMPPLSSPSSTATNSLDTWATLAADRDQIARLLTNLVGNAIQYTPPSGSVAVELQRQSRLSHHVLQMTVTDTGIGIAVNDIPRLFDRFYRVDSARSQKSGAGSGLGLAIAQAIVENHHGHIQIESNLGQGTCVTVSLPQRHTEAG